MLFDTKLCCWLGMHTTWFHLGQEARSVCLLQAAFPTEASANLCLTGDCLAHVSPRPERMYCQGRHRLSTGRALAATCVALSSATARPFWYQAHGLSKYVVAASTLTLAALVWMR